MQHYLNRFGSDKRANLIALVCTIATALVVICIFNVVQELGYKSKCAQVKQNLHAIQLAVERFAVDDPHGSYPREIREVMSRGYLPEFPVNPFTGLPMRCVEELTDAEKFRVEYVPPDAEPGDFIYYKRYGKGGQQSADEAPQGYTLAAYM